VGKLHAEFSAEANKYDASIAELEAEGLLQQSGERLQLTARGRLLSNEVFEKFLMNPATR